MRRRWSFAVVLLVVVAAGCRPKHPYQWVQDVPASHAPVESVPLRPGDVVQVQVHNWEELRLGVSYTINADGSIVLPLVGAFDIEGMTVEEVAQKLDAKLKGMIEAPRARVSLVTHRTPVVTVVGEVATPGRFEVSSDEGLLPALALAGGLTEFADVDGIYVVRKYPTRQRIRFRYADLTGGVQQAVDFKLRDGDVVVVE